jgi:hypothetical protein
MKLFDQHTDGPAIADDVVHGQQQDVFPGLQAHQLEAQQRALLEIEGLLGLLSGKLLKLLLALCFLQSRKVFQKQRQPSRWMNELVGLAILAVESGAQNFVSCDELGEAVLKCLQVERALHLN